MSRGQAKRKADEAKAAAGCMATLRPPRRGTWRTRIMTRRMLPLALRARGLRKTITTRDKRNEI